MPQTAIGADVHQTLDVHLDALAEVAFDFALGFQNRANATELFFAQVTDARVELDLRLAQNRTCARSANTVNVSKTDLGTLIRRKIYTCYTSHAGYLGLRIIGMRT